MQIKEKNPAQVHVFVAMSGGVDSSVATALLKEQGYQVTGVYMKNWSGDSFGIQTDCPWEQDQKDVETVCKILDIPFRSFNFEQEYHEKVIKYFLDEIAAGRTPNPDIMCNKEIKFSLFLDKARSLGADFIATGHYARVKYNKKSQEYELLKGKDFNKDQSYFLHILNQEQLGRTLFPLGDLRKTEVRRLAEKFKLPVAQKPDSQGICFIGEINVSQFLRANFPVKTGLIIDVDTGKEVGIHDGVAFYTIGQREGLKIGGAGLPYYSAGKDKLRNILFAAKGVNNPALFKKEVVYSKLHIISGNLTKNVEKPEQLNAMIRYRQEAAPGKLMIKDRKFVFAKPQRAVAEGQSI
ncbi:MAG TPA: tRNA 2-thiouridine(34) synthase MnmA, partial [Candidatus Dojkabacteria bacterium]|nr:tRNA 2-thiouridine(34) synthase MnmA [Candidatus Dojkabacteria bacterium]